MDKVKTLQTKLNKLQKEADKLGKVYTKSGNKWGKANDRVNRIHKLIKDAKTKEMIDQPIVIGGWYNYKTNEDVFFKVNRQSMDGTPELFMVNIHNRIPTLSLVAMDRKVFFEECKRIERPPVDKIIDKIRSFINE